MSNLNISLLSETVRARRGSSGLRETAKQIGEISASTLSRIEKGNVPDVETYIKICEWLEVSTDTFIQKASQNLKQINAHFRASRELPIDTVNSIITLLNLAESNPDTD